VLTVRPRRWVKLGIGEHELPEIGVFASDSPHRPNPIAVTIVEPPSSRR
jgi:tRNA (Thr-GGU) A37 N-methylase